jgi:glycosyltransferase involved in cell wall biosynthesis
MKVAMISPFPRPGEPPRGGVQIAATRLVRALGEREIEVTVIPLHAGNHTPGTPRGPLPGTDNRFLAVRNLRPMRKAVTEQLRGNDFDIVHAQGVVPAGYVVTHIPLDGAPGVITAHGNRREDTLADYAGVGARARWILGRRMAVKAARRADVVVGVHPDWDVNLPIPPANFVYIPNIVEDLFFAAPRSPEHGRVLYCGGVDAIKGLDLLLSCWPRVVQRLPEARLHAVGCSSASGVIAQAIEGSVEIDEWLRPRELVDAMARAAVIVVPSRYEVAPMIIGEAWAAKVPVVATAVGGIPALAGGAARVVRPDPVALADALVLSLTEPNDDFVEEGARRAQLHRQDAVVTAHIGLYRSLVAARNAGEAPGR